jgi:uridine phosphorylase
MLELLNFDDSPHAVIDPFRDEGYVFPERMLFAFVDAARIDEFCRAHHGRVLATFETISNVFHVQQVIVDGQPVGICRAPLGAPAATQLLEFLIAYGARQIVATGSCGVLTDQAENEFLVVQRALRDEGTSFHYLPAADSVTLNAAFAARVKTAIESQGNAAKFVNTWTTDAFFRETAAKVAARRQAGYTVVEMECAALAACAQFRQVQFGQILFTGDSLAAARGHDARDFGENARMAALELGSRCLAQLL